MLPSLLTISAGLPALLLLPNSWHLYPHKPLFRCSLTQVCFFKLQRAACLSGGIGGGTAKVTVSP